MRPQVQVEKKNNSTVDAVSIQVKVVLRCGGTARCACINLYAKCFAIDN